MNLSLEDSLRLNILLANNVQAIRIDESTMTVYGLSEYGEAKVQLHPTSRDEQYLKWVRELISGQMLSSPGSYPAYLNRWHRMGQTKEESLEQLLKLGEPEAVVAVVNAHGLTPELGRRAWWSLPNSENARSMLRNTVIVNSELGKILAQHLVDHLPFEEDVTALMESVQLVLQRNLIESAVKQQIWENGRLKNAYFVGFLKTLPDNLPQPLPARVDALEIEHHLRPLATTGNELAKQLLRITTSAGQTFLETCVRVLQKPSHQEVVNTLFDVIASYFANIRPQHFDEEMNIITLIERASRDCENCQDQTSIERREILTLLPALQSHLNAMLILSGLGYWIVRPIFSRTTAIGSLMNKKLAPVTVPILEQFAILRRGVNE